MFYFVFGRTPLPDFCVNCTDGDKCEELEGPIFEDCHHLVNASYYFRACRQDARSTGEVSQHSKENCFVQNTTTFAAVLQ